MKKLLVHHGILIFATLVLANVAAGYLAWRVLFAQSCFSASQVASDNRCLYIWNNKVFEKGTKSSPHKGHPCGTDVSAFLPGSHASSLASYMDPNFRGTICSLVVPSTTPKPTASVTPTRTPTPVPSVTRIPTPTIQITLTPVPTDISLPSPTSLPSITVTQTPILTPTLQIQPIVTVSPTQIPNCPVPPSVQNLRISCPSCGGG